MSLSAIYFIGSSLALPSLGLRKSPPSFSDLRGRVGLRHDGPHSDPACSWTYVLGSSSSSASEPTAPAR